MIRIFIGQSNEQVHFLKVLHALDLCLITFLIQKFDSAAHSLLNVFTRIHYSFFLRLHPDWPKMPKMCIAKGVDSGMSF